MTRGWDVATMTVGVGLEVFGNWIETENCFNLLFCPKKIKNEKSCLA